MSGISIYLSYAWNDAATEDIIRKLEPACENARIELIRDINEMDYGESISAFMDQLGEARGIVVIVSRKYLQSYNCFYELLAIYNNQQFRQRVFPIVLEDAGIFDDATRLEYISYWERQTNKLEQLLKDNTVKRVATVVKKLDLYADIRHHFDQIVSMLADMNSLTAQIHKNTNFDALLETVSERLGAQQVDSVGGGQVTAQPSDDVSGNNGITANSIANGNITGTQNIQGNNIQPGRDYVVQNITAAGPVRNKALTLRPPVLPSIVGRKAELAELKQNIDSQQRTVLLAGLGGIGKSTLCAYWYDSYTQMTDCFFG